MPRSVRWAPGPPPRQQLEPEGPGGCTGECRPHPCCAWGTARGLGAAPVLPSPLHPFPRLSRQDLASVLFSDAALPPPAALPARPLPPAGKRRARPPPTAPVLGAEGPAGGGLRGVRPGAARCCSRGRMSPALEQADGETCPGGAGTGCPERPLSALPWVPAPPGCPRHSPVPPGGRRSNWGDPDVPVLSLNVPCTPPGMGSKPSPCGSLQGFGFSSERSGSGKCWLLAGLCSPPVRALPCLPLRSPSLRCRLSASQGSSPASAGEALLSTIQRAAEAVANAVLPSPEAPRPPCRELHEDAYQPVTAPSPSRSSASSTRPPAAPAARSARGESLSTSARAAAGCRGGPAGFPAAFRGSLGSPPPPQGPSCHSPVCRCRPRSEPPAGAGRGRLGGGGQRAQLAGLLAGQR